VVAEQQELLAIDDLVAFAINARRLIENTIKPKRAGETHVQAITGANKEYVAITRIINCIIHNRDVEVIGSVGHYRLYTGEKNLHIIADDFGKPIDPICL
jgi:hypothetical protein